MRDVLYITSPELHQSLENIDKIRQRSYLVDGLIQAYDLDKHNSFRFSRPQMATEQELCSAHDRDYLDFLKLIASKGDDPLYREEMDLFKLGYECPPFEQLPSFCA